MDKFRRVRKTATPPQQNLPATSSSAGAPSSTSSTKFTIEQKIATGAVKKGPYSVKRTVDPNDVVIKRRLGEGSKPLFSRADIYVNRSVSPKKQTTTRASSSDSSSPEDRNRHRVNSSKSQVNKRKSAEKVPYFLDEKREKDRIKRVYGESRRSRSSSHERRRRISNIRSRSRTPPSYRRYRNYSERRSSSRDRYQQRRRTEYSRSRSRSRERRRISLSRRNGSMNDRQPPPQPQPATQFIPIPVPVEYPFMQPAWGTPMMPPQPRFPFLLRPTLPPPMSYMPRHLFRPPRYVQNSYQRGNFRPRQY